MGARIIINETLNRIQQREGLTEQALAHRLEVAPTTVWRWRNGEVGKAATILIPLILREWQAEIDQALSLV